ELEETWYKGIKQLMPATMLCFQINTGHFSLKEYWQPEKQEFLFSPERLSQVFTEAVKKRIPADVNRAAFLSGGVDSTAIVAELLKHSVDILPCVISYKHEPESVDSNYANLFAKKLGLSLQEVVVDPRRNNLLIDTVNAVQRPIIHGGEMGMMMAYEQISGLG